MLDNLRRRGSALNVNRLLQRNVEFVHGDIRNPSDLKLTGAPAQLIIECSAECSAQVGYGASPAYLIETNLMGCFNCLELARLTRADFLFLSTSRVYPESLLNSLAFSETNERFVLSADQTLPGATELGISECFPTHGARSLYGMTKLAAALMIAEYKDAYGLRFIINRCGLISGPWQVGKSDRGVAALWMASHFFKRSLRYMGFGGKGKQVRDILHIAELCRLVEAQIVNLKGYAGQVLKAGGGLANSLSLLEMTRLCEAITGNKIDIGATLEQRQADLRIYVTDHSAVSSLGGWPPSRTAECTLHDIYSWIRAEEHLLRPLFT